ncbi:hypothetical protein NVS55_10105 [Myxococcus stipitatus]|uniref:hypothetical protein n=1 Tax=Myxococcus stipitatus TaxID=83455 RepID=UPI003144FFE0
MSERHIEMFWRCSSCSHRNLGRHQVCQQCKNAKDGSEEYEMPEDPSSAVSVTDEALLRMATAGPNWRCAYCESDQRAYDGSCKNCGAALPEPAEEAPQPAPELPPETKKRKRLPWYVWALIIGVLACCPCFVCSGSMKDKPQALQVKAVTWEHTVSVERYRLTDKEGFAEDRPDGALQVKPLGTRHHHDERILTGYETVYYTEKRQDGYTTESYKDKEACGEDCSRTPKKCKETCTSNKNGFATCKETCTGGEERCTTRYCTVKKTRKVPRYVDERRSRKEPRYRSEPREAPWFAWKEWTWSHDRDVKARGNTLATHWPSEAELKPAQALLNGEKERDTRTGTYSVVFQGTEAKPDVTYTPKSLEEFQRFGLGSTHNVQEKDGQVSIVVEEKPSAPAPEK